jgi:hypothetical protein
MSKRILIVSYYYPPENSISSRRPLAFAKAFQEAGYDVTVLTRHWDIDNFKTFYDLNQPSDKHSSSGVEYGIKTIRIGYKHISSLKYMFKYGATFIDSLFLLRKLFIRSLNMEMNVFFNFYSFLKEHLKHNSYDIILVSIYPLNLLRVLHKFKEQIPVTVADVRDYYNNHMLTKNYNPSFSQRLQNSLIERNLSKWFRNISLIVSVNDSILKKIEKFNNSRKLKVLNGFEQDSMEGLTDKVNNQFTISILGGVFFQQRLDIMVDGFKKFIAGKPDVKINFVGAKMYPDVGEYIEKMLPFPQVEVTNRLPRARALEYGVNSHVLFYLGWKGYEGMYSGKIFEYLGLRKNILICPGDDDVIDELLRITNAGISVDSAKEMAQALERWYSEWKQNVSLQFYGKEEEIVKYTREIQSQILVKEINELNLLVKEQAF